MKFNTITTIIFALIISAQLGFTVGNESLIDLRDKNSIHAHQPLLIAHRGGYVTDGAPENSLASVKLAAERGYGMLEVDIRETKDHIIVCFHDNDMNEDIGIDNTIENLTFDELSKLRYRDTDERIVTLDEYLELSTTYNMGIMLDIKTEGNDDYFKGIADLIEKYKLTHSTVTISRHPLAEQYLKGKALLRLSKEDEKLIAEGKDVDVSGKFWFDWPRYISNDMVKKIQARGCLVIPSINIFHYPADEHMERAKKDIERMMEAGVDGYQIDGVYDVYFNK